MNHLLAQWRKVASGVHGPEPSPLNYGGRSATRLWVDGPPLESSHQLYFSDPTLAGFVDVVFGGYVYINYLAIRPESRGQGLARKLIQAVYDEWPEREINWGELHEESMGHLYRDYQSLYPDRTFGGKVRY